MSQKPATIKEIAKRLNVSVSTVSRALHNHPSIGLRTKMQVQKLAEELNYEPNQAAISFKQGKTSTIGVILPNLREEFFSTAINGIEDIAIHNSYTVLIGQSRDDVEREKKLVDTMRKHRVDGLLVSLSKNTVDYEHFEALKKYGIPVVFFDRVPNLDDAYTVSCDLKDSSEKLVDWLLAQGHTKIGFIKGPESMTASQDRLQGYLHALEKNKLPQVPGYIVQTNLEKEETQQAIQQLLSLPERPTAVIAFNDYITLDAIKFSRALGLKINKDIYFVSYANLPVTSYLDDRPLASVEQFPYEQAEKATEMLLQLINQKAEEIEEKRVVMSGEVVANEPSLKGG
ncbi:LacI family transcriptional regulator [Terrimonas sp. NA20]|uniref:LacI family transcriptional regulator n=1 Tax=Terrimonas ginsenosidimutans TaxID=2908004 RepID=A0ABS9KRH3_9BACT|nr:LacI family transcriptional regulator [Terrimonas ginsenosidimutans]